MLSHAVAALALAGSAVAGCTKPNATSTYAPTSTVDWNTAYTASASADVAAAAATAKTASPTSHVKGKAFDRYVTIWFENTNFAKAKNDPNFAFFVDKGITLDNFYAVTHPSQPNYISSFAGDYFGMNHDDFTRADVNVSTVVDLLDTKHISWAMYQEDMPYTGYEGYEWLNQDTGANDYVRKHNPAVTFDKLTQYEDNLMVVKNLSLIDPARSQFHIDLDNNALPQWMFITPNMTDDCHDSDITTGGIWLRAFLEPLLEDKNFMQNTLVLVTFDENEDYTERNQILSVLLGDAVPEHLVGTTDSHYYNHYSELATVQANWDLPSLGRNDVGANVYDLVAQKTGDKLRQWTGSDFESHYFNLSYNGVFNDYDGGNKEYPAPNVALPRVLPAIKQQWEGSENPTYYRDSVETYDGLNPPADYPPTGFE